MRIVTVARKPIGAKSTTENVVDFQVGALHIDATRVAWDPESLKQDTARRQTPRTDIKGGSFHTGGGHLAAYEGDRSSPPGRWPANVILAHKKGCQVVGQRKVNSGTAVREKSGGKTIFSEQEKPPLENMSYADADGKETIPEWRCVTGCPTANMDQQSGKLTSGSGTVKRASSKSQKGNQAFAFGSENRVEGSPQVWYGDSGGASRFFKQIVEGSGETPKNPACMAPAASHSTPSPRSG